MYAIVKTGGKQYRVEQGQSLLVERLPVEDGGKFELEPLLYVDGTTLVDGAELSKVTVEAKVLAHERGPKLRIVKFKPKRGYRRRNGHRQELTRIEVTSLKLAARTTEATGAAETAGVTEPTGAAEIAGVTEPTGAAEIAGATSQTSKEAGNGS